jgi:Recombinase/Recombinase zinc beta ribbon domain
MWGRTTISRILKEPAYMGETIVWRWKTDPVTKRIAVRPDDEQIRLAAGVTPPIVSPETWEQAQLGLIRNRSTKTRNETRPYLLRGLMVCAVCGSSMSPDTERGGRVYRCLSRCTPTGPCGGKRVTADDTVRPEDCPRDAIGRMIAIDEETRSHLATIPGVESWAWNYVTAILQDSSIFAAELERQGTSGPDPALAEDTETARARLSKIDNQQRQLIETFAEQEVDTFVWEMVQEQVTRLEQEKATINRIIGDLEHQLSAQRSLTDKLVALSGYLDHVPRSLESFGFEQRRLALEVLGVHISANGRSWKIECRIPAGELNSTSSSSDPASEDSLVS